MNPWQGRVSPSLACSIEESSVKKKQKRMNVILLLAFLAGLSLLLYPGISDYWNARHATQAIAGYTEKVADLNAQTYAQMYLDAVAYNTAHAGGYVTTELSESDRAQYESLLNVTGTGVMGYVEIEKLRVNLPIYHGTEESVLQVAAGHIDWSSLPVGGDSTHCVLSGHRGLPSAKLFTDLDQLREGDTFSLHVLNEMLTYQVDQIRIVKPNVTKDLAVEKGKDYCTLVTCTPYGINTHRLLVRGHRVATAEEGNVTADAIIVEPLLVAPMLAVPMLLALLLFAMKKPKGNHFPKNGGNMT